MASGIWISDATWRRVQAAVLDYERRAQGGGTSKRSRETFTKRAFVEGVLLENLDAPTDGMEEPTKAKMKVWAHDPENEDALRETEREVELTNRDKTLEGSEGDYVIAVGMKGEWRILWLACDEEE